jgi:hypothetical protein
MNPAWRRKKESAPKVARAQQLIADELQRRR